MAALLTPLGLAAAGFMFGFGPKERDAEANADYEVEWRLPVGCGFSGFFTEVVLGFLPALSERLPVRLLSGQCEESWLTANLDPADAAAFRAAWVDEAKRTRKQTAASIAIEHGEPCGMRTWPSKSPDRPIRVISRSMTESNLEPEQAECLRDRADAAWVPTAWHVERFVAAGVDRSLLHVVPEPVDTVFFSPVHRTPRRAAVSPREPFVFFSNFKWEWRKGWDLLLDAFWAEFGSDEAVRLDIKTWLPPWEGGAEIEVVVADRARGTNRSRLPPVRMLQDDVTRASLRDLYAAADAFVLPTRGEGWGLPIAEAMAMGLPVIATNWSGPSAYLSTANSHPLPVATLLAAGFAEPSVPSLQAALRRAFDERGEVAERRGRLARADIERCCSRAAVAEVVLQRLRVGREPPHSHQVEL